LTQSRLNSNGEKSKSPEATAAIKCVHQLTVKKDITLSSNDIAKYKRGADAIIANLKTVKSTFIFFAPSSCEHANRRVKRRYPKGSRPRLAEEEEQ
jgi:hypothetical protein